MSDNNSNNIQQEKPMKGAEIVVKCLELAGVHKIFAYPGGASMELHQALKKSHIQVILPRHEQGGAFAAQGFARATGKTGVCMATSGPGATNLLTAIADAYMDSIPLVAITGQVPSSLIGGNAFQETDIIGMSRPVVKHSYLVLNAEDLTHIFAEAFFIANSGRPGPVLIDLPKNIQQQICVPDFSKETMIRAYTHMHTLDPKKIEEMKDMISKASRPCIYAGGGIITANAAEALTKFAISYNIPVATTLQGIGGFPEDNPLSLKFLGMHGTVYANNAVNEADLVIALGCRFDDRVTGPPHLFAENAKIVHVDIDQSEINKNRRVDLAIIADVKEVLDALNENPVHKEYNEWLALIKKWKEEYPLTYEERDDIQPQYAIELLYKLTNGEAIIVPGVGQHQMWAAQYYCYKYPRQFHTSGGLGTMGFGLPASIGVKIARPDKTVVNIDGDGSAQMNIQELATIHNENIDVKIMILNNQHLGMVAQWEDRFYNSVRGDTVLKNKRINRPYPDFVTIAKGYNIPGREVYEKSELEDAIKEMLAADGPFLLDIHIEYKDHVLPMIPPAKTYKNILTE